MRYRERLYPRYWLTWAVFDPLLDDGRHWYSNVWFNTHVAIREFLEHKAALVFIPRPIGVQLVVSMPVPELANGRELVGISVHASSLTEAINASWSLVEFIEAHADRCMFSNRRVTWHVNWDCVKVPSRLQRRGTSLQQLIERIGA